MPHKLIMLLPQYALNATNILFLMHKLLLSSTETLLIILYDPDCSLLTTAILRQTYTQSIVAYQITNSTTVESLHQSNNIIDNAIVISIFCRNRPSIAQQTLTRYYNHFYINRKFTHFCLIHTKNYNDKKMEMTDFIRSFLKLNVRMVPVLITKRNEDYDFNVFTSSSSWSYSPSTQTLSTEYSSSFLMHRDKHLNMNELLVPVINIQNQSAYYFCSDYNAPLVYRVRAFSENVTLFIGGTEVRMMNLIAERMKWNVQFCLPPSKPPYYNIDNYDEVDSTFYNRIVRTSMARIRQYSLETANCNG